MALMRGIQVMKMCSYPLAYACKHKDIDIRLNSRSGGVFTGISDSIINSGGKVYGCIMTDDFLAKHVGTSDFSVRDKMRGSKYIPSDLGNTFKEVEKDLSQGIKVLYTGLPCQIDGLKAYLNAKNTNTDCLFTADIVCNGVPSQKIWKMYLDYVSNRTKKTFDRVECRDKKHFGWEDHIESFYSGKKRISAKVFRNLYHSNEILRPSCYCCPYKSINRTGDITLGDFWGIKEKASDFDDNKGVSLCLVNSKKGEELFHAAKKELEIREFAIHDVMQTALMKSNPLPNDRPYFWDLADRGDFKKIAKEYGQDSIITRTWIKLPQSIKKAIKKIF